MLERRARRFLNGEWEALWNEVRVRSLDTRPTTDDDAIADHAMMLVREGLYSKAAAALESEG